MTQGRVSEWEQLRLSQRVSMAPEQLKNINDKLDLLIERQQEFERNDEQLARLVAEVRRVVGVLESGQGGRFIEKR